MSLRSHVQILLLAAALFLCSALPAQRPSPPVAKDLIQGTVESLAKIVGQEYFDAEMAERVGKRLRDDLAQGQYDDASSPRSLARMLTRDVFAVTKDKHLSVFVVRKSDADESSDNKPDVSREERARQANFGIQRVEILPGNVGYLNVTHFYRPEEARDTLAAAMRVLQSADTLIIDMRQNSGGSPGTVAMLASYVFAEPDLPLFKIIGRRSGSRQYSTQAEPPPSRNGTRRVFVLTSARTFSAGEGFAYILQERRRATVIGETTAGAANPGRPFPVNEHFEAVIPTGRIATAIRGGNWEGTGVKPDVPSPAAQALDAALAQQ